MLEDREAMSAEFTGNRFQFKTLPNKRRAKKEHASQKKNALDNYNQIFTYFYV